MPSPKSGIGYWYDKFATFNVESLFSRSREPGPPRSVLIHQDLPPDFRNAKGKVTKDHVYCTNQVITSKYTIITFLPRNLLEQFRRVANVFFLAIAILQFFSIFSTVSPGLVILPLLIILVITAAKDGYEDIKRHQSDRRVNYSPVRVLRGGEFINHNVTGSKSRTFVRGLLPRSKPKASKVEKTSDAEAVQHVALPETIMSGSPQVHPHDDDMEFDYPLEGQESLEDQEQRKSGLHLFGQGHEEHHPHWKKSIWEDLKVGDFVKIRDDEAVPADIIICATSEDDNVAFVETKNLDGETNLKSRNACPGLTHLRSAKDCADTRNAFRLDADRPDSNMYKFNATVVTPDESFPIDLQETLLRGSVVRHTAWVIGLVVFTGRDSKVILNSGITPSKRSKVERQMNPQVFINLAILATMAVVCGIVDAVLEQHFFPLGAPWLFGDTQSNDNPRINGLITFIFAFLTFQNIVPISLYISIEVVRTAQAAFIYFDKDIWYAKTNQPTLARSWNLSDDLGQIEYIFSDKTGTLTQNVMVFKQCSIRGKIYSGDILDDNQELGKAEAKVDLPSRGSSAEIPSEPRPNQSFPTIVDAGKPQTAPERKFRDFELSKDINSAIAAEPNSEDASRARSLNGFFTVLSLCHTVLTAVDPETGAIQYKAQSPDEEALVQAAADVGYVFRGRERDKLHLQTPFSDQVETYRLLNILEFTSARKRMSVIVKKEDETDDRLFLLTKGADNVIFERLKPGADEDWRTVTEDHLSEFASQGLRTLTLAYKVIPQDEYDAWGQKYREATVALEYRTERVEEVAGEIEQDLRLLGATAIEDRLQDGVPETIADLKTAGIKVWVATGDKLETAIAIGHSTNLIAPDANVIIIRGGEKLRPVYTQIVNSIKNFFPESDLAEQQEYIRSPTSLSGGSYPLRRISTDIASLVGSDNGERPGGFVLVIDGLALTQAFSDDAHKDLLLKLAMKCEAVICCRVSPLQKALIVRLVKDGLGTMTLAIGDGANDVSMIQAADIGVGISGEEGLQAVNSSDYAIGQFRYLKRLLLVHGHWSYARNGNMIVNFFYKNIIAIGVLWWFQIYCGWSSQYVFEYTYILFWNSFWTIAPVIAIGLFDRILDDDVLMALPELYRFGREGHWYNTNLFLIYMFDGIAQSAILYFLILYAYRLTTARSDGFDVALYEFSTTMVMATVIVANLFNGLCTNVWTGWVFFAVAIGIVLNWAYTAIYSIISPGWFATPVYGNDHFLFLSPYFWFSILLTVPLSLAPRYLWKSYRFIFAPDDIDILRWTRKVNKNFDFAHEANVSAISRLRRQDDSRSVTLSRRSTMEGERRPTPSLRNASRTDMSTGLRSVHRGFDFATEESGPAMRRLQSNLSGVRQDLPKSQERKKHTFSLTSITRSLKKKRQRPSPPPTDRL